MPYKGRASRLCAFFTLEVRVGVLLVVDARHGYRVSAVLALVRRLLLWLCLCCAALACDGSARLIKLRSPENTESGVRLEVLNNTDVVIAGVYMARTEDVKKARRGHSRWGSEAEAETWGDDRLNADLPAGSRVEVVVPSPGRWDMRPVDEDGRYQHIVGLVLRPGGRYRLEINDGNWRAFEQ